MTASAARLDTSDPEAALSRAARRLRRLFDQDARLTRDKIGKALGCTPRHGSRVLQELRDVGVPVEEARDGRAKVFYVPTVHQRRQIQLDSLDEEALRALTVAAEASRAVLRGTSLAAPLDRAFQTLLDAVGDQDVYSFDPELEAGHWHFGNAAAPGAERLDVMRALDRAITHGQSARIDYTNGRGERSVARLLDPLAMAPFSSGWQLAAYCHTRRAVRNFNPARIDRVELVTDRYFAPPDDFDADEHFGGRFGALDGSDRLHTVRLRVAPEVAQHFHSRDYHTSQRAEPDVERPGGLLVTYQVTETKTMRSFVRSWGAAVVALAPPELVAQLAQDARDAADAYGA